MARESYGIDAPFVVRNLALGGLACAVAWAAGQSGGVPALRDLGPLFLGPAIGMIGGTCWMLADRAVGAAGLAPVGDQAALTPAIALR